MATYADYDVLCKVIMLGDAGVGKTCLHERFVEGSYQRQYYGGTIGVEFGVRTLGSPAVGRVKLQVWDTAGQERFRSVTRSYYRGAHGVVLCYDSTNPATLASIPAWIAEVRRWASPDVQIALVGCKCDLPAAVTSEHVTAAVGGERLLLAETSALTGDGVDVAFQRLADAMVRCQAGGSTERGGGIRLPAGAPRHAASEGPRDAAKPCGC